MKFLPTFVCFFSWSLAAGVLAAEPVQLPGAIDFTVQDFRGKEVSLKDFDNSRCVVLAFLGTECPLAKLYSVRLESLFQNYSRDDVMVIGINSNAQDSLTEMESFVHRHKLTYPMLKDRSNRVADELGADRTPQVFLLDQNRIVRYQGRVDDQYVVGISRDQPQHEDLKFAIDELLSGKPVSVPKTKALGCLIGRVETPDETCTVTYSNQISRIFQKHCVQCHRSGEIAPFTMTSYDDVVGWGPMIAEVVQERRMPPWHADSHFGTFENDTSLSHEDRQLIATWVEHGCPEGDSSELPEPLTFVEGWQLKREPDVVIQMQDQPFDVPAEGGPKGVRYQHFWIEAGVNEDRWVDGMEIRPGNRAVVHHVIVYVTSEKNEKRRQSLLAAYVPGLRLNPLPAGSAKKIPAGSWLHFEVHYTPIGTPQQDLTSIGLLFANPEEITHEIRTTVVGKRDFVIQPQLSDQEFTARSGKSPVDVELLSLSPHMHLRGQAFAYEAEYPDGTREELLKVPAYDFNWQTQYRLAQPKLMPAGTIIHCTAKFDNSPQNLANPDPTATVRWGDQSWEEMFLGYMDIMFPKVPSAGSGSEQEKIAQLQLLAQQINPEDVMRRLDKNQDGMISREEAKRSKLMVQFFDRVDKNSDDQVSFAEIQVVLNRDPQE